VGRVTVTGFTSMTFYLYTKQSGVLTLVGTSAPLTTYPGLLNTIDIRVKAGAGGIGAFYAGGTQIFNVTGLDNSGFAGVDQIKLYGIDSNAAHDATSYWSQVICDSVSTIGRFLRTDRLNSNSAVNTGWTGSVTDINELPTNDSTFIDSAASGQISTFYESGMDLTGLNILARGVSARMRVQGSGPPNLDLTLRSGSGNYFASPIPASAGFQASFNSWTTNPDGSVAWTPSTAQATEVGAKSAA
jgi:hypothetical protein